MSRNTLADLKGHLFAQLERLADGTLTPEQIDAEVRRTEAIVSLSDQITDGARLQLSAAKLYAEHGKAVLPMLPQIGPAATEADE